jgi:predicted NAD/FAD-binding protein
VSDHQAWKTDPYCSNTVHRWNHDLLNTFTRGPDWLTLEGGAKSYIDTVTKGFPPNHLFLKTPVKHLTNDEDGRVRLHFEKEQSNVFDHVILATHGDKAFKMIQPSATAEEKAVMSAFKTSENTCYVHSDVSLMPRRRQAWSAWNNLTQTIGNEISKVSVTYDLNILQQIPRSTFGDVLVTLNPLRKPKSDTVQGRYSYSRPQYTPAAIKAQRSLARVQNTRGISYAGSWTKHGFHEDGFSSGLYVAREHLGAKLPFEFVDSTGKPSTNGHGRRQRQREREPRLGIWDWILRLIIMLVQVFLIDIPGSFLRTGIRTGRRVGGHVNGISSRMAANGPKRA